MMIRRRIVRAVAVWAFAAAWLNAPLGAGQLVPFAASIATTPGVVGACGPACVVLEIGGSGTARHLGRVEINGPSEANLATLSQTGTSTLTAASGDSFTFVFSGTIQPTGMDPADLLFFEGSWQIVSGTGRFAGATGSGTYGGSAAGPSGTLNLTGEISTVGQGPSRRS